MKQLNSMEDVKRELKRIASIKCRLKKQQGKANYKEELQKVLEEEQYIKSMREQLSETKKTVTKYTEDDIAQLSYDETVRAIKSIQSKKSLTKWLTSEEGNNDEYRAACQIETLLKAHRDLLAPEVTTIKDKLQEIVVDAEMFSLSAEEIIDKLKELL